ncbi:unnamed protein product [Ilex paraguariensis]|uniref:Uncharacterized protein n=1 Tax=Ilex paraguariensis TaxID=185542 RepID=A0ABC8UX50_9AQUA
MKTSFLILFFFCICLLVGHGQVDAISIAPRRKTLGAKQPNFNVSPNSCGGGGGGGNQCSQLAQRCFNAGNIFFHWRAVENGPVQFTFTFADDCCKAASQIGNYCARDGFYKIITKACTGNNGGGNDHSGHTNHNGNGNGNPGNNRPKGFLGTNGSPQCSPIVQKCMYGSSHFSFSFHSGSDGVPHYVYDFAPDCCSPALQITGDCAQDADVTIITGTCRG